MLGNANLFIGIFFKIFILLILLMSFGFVWFKATFYICDLLDNKFGDFIALVFLITSICAVVASIMTLNVIL